MTTDVVVGQISGLHGIQGALRIKSFCVPPERVFSYKPWKLVRPERDGLESAVVENITPIRIRGAGTNLVARLSDIEDRDQAALWLGALIRVPKASLPKLAPGEFYWSELVGLRVNTVSGVELGTIESLFATGSNDVMVVRGDRERLLPYLPGQCVINVDPQAGTMLVDWDAEF